jgi:hypothetical protein
MLLSISIPIDIRKKYKIAASQKEPMSRKKSLNPLCWYDCNILAAMYESERKRNTGT